MQIGKSLKAFPQAKTCQIVRLPLRKDKERARVYNIVYEQ